MEDIRLFYSIIQFSPFPERFEYMNAGVAVFEKRGLRVAVKLADDLTRVRKVFGEINATFLKAALHDFSQRVIMHFSRASSSVSSGGIEEFNSKRAELFRLTPLNAVAGDYPDVVAGKLFDELVAWRGDSKKIDRVNTLLTNAFRDAGVLSLLDRRPEPVHIAQYDVSIQADYGYQNGVYNLIDAARFDNPQRGLAEAGKRVLEGKALHEMLSNRLIVVGEFGSQPARFIDNLRGDFESVGAKLFRLEEVDELAKEIRKTTSH
jgi:hypothetical protein